MPEPSEPVIIAGAGPTGLALAGELALAGIPCRIFERRPEPTKDSRALCLHARSMEMLDLRGLASRFLDTGMPVPSFPLGLKDATIDFRRLDSDFNYLFMIPQSQIEDLLEARARELGAEVVRSAELEDVEQDADGVTVRLADGTIQRTPYLIGCDGLHSSVRQALGVPFPGFPNPGSVGLADLRLDGLPMTDAYGEMTDSGMLLVLPFRDGSCRVVLYDYARAGAPVEEPVTLEEVRESLVRITGRDFEPRDMYWSSRYRSESRQVADYRHGRVFLAGDAAHTHSPAGAQGLNTGFQDSFNLGWKLAAELEGRAPDWLLDSYSAERHPVGAAVLQLTGRQFKLNVAKTRRRKLLRWAAYRLLAPLPPSQTWLANAYSGISVGYQPRDGSGHPLTGQRLPRGRLNEACGQATRFYEYFHEGRFVLFASGEVPRDLPKHVRVVEYANATRKDWPSAVLVRPDGYIAWAAGEPEPAEIREAVLRWVPVPGA